MTTTTETAVSHCRACHQRIGLDAGRIWADSEGDAICPAAPEPRPHDPVPDSAVVDQVIRWDEVQPGDLFLHEDDLVLAETVTVYEDDWQGHKWMRADITYQGLDGRTYLIGEHADRLTAVRRYTEGER